MSEDELMEFAKRLAAQRIVVSNHGMMNKPYKTEDQIKADAAYMIARDKLGILERTYQDALRKFVDGTQNGTAPTVYNGPKNGTLRYG